SAFLQLIERASLVISDSGGVQEEAAFLGTPSVTLRNTTEWPETVWEGWNVLSPFRASEVLSRIRLQLEKRSHLPAKRTLPYSLNVGERTIEAIQLALGEKSAALRQSLSMEEGYPFLHLKTPGVSTNVDVIEDFMAFDKDGNYITPNAANSESFRVIRRWHSWKSQSQNKKNRGRNNS
ncbi:MAG TPA: UDP-N-acetylglucosamine 2-epimerase, partial [Candidatus Hodarchaeales archaeon]|nr:UDP-N-acetylglucosamine 2-epimerase [Candidatus Hodarchaeales archaeon]